MVPVGIMEDRLETVVEFYENRKSCWKNNSIPKIFFGPLSKKGYAEPPPPLISGHAYIKDAQCAETNEKPYFRFFDL